MEKVCSCCKELKPLESFQKKESGKYKVASKCKLCVNAWSKIHYKKNRKRLLKLRSERYFNNKEKHNEQSKLYYKLNKVKLRAYSKEYTKNKLKTDPSFKLMNLLRVRLRESLINKKWLKKNSFTKHIGCSREELISHLEKQFKPGMSWENHGFYGWHVDHIIPLSSAKTEEQMYALCHYTNLQPLWAEENLKKSDNIWG